MKKNHEKKFDTEKLLIKHAEELLTVDVCYIIFCRYFIIEYVCIKHHVLDNVLFIYLLPTNILILLPLSLQNSRFRF